MSQLDSLRGEVSAQPSVIASTVALLSGLGAKLKEANDRDDAGTIDDIVKDLMTLGQSFGAAVAQNTAASAEAPTGMDTLSVGESTDYRGPGPGTGAVTQVPPGKDIDAVATAAQEGAVPLAPASGAPPTPGQPSP